MKPSTIHHVESSWALVQPVARQAAAMFYDELFKLDPSLRALFKGDMPAQGARLMLMIGAAVAQLRRLDTRVPVLQSLGRRHATYGVVEAHYTWVGKALLSTLSEGLGPAFAAEVRAAWAEVYEVRSAVMCDASARQVSQA